MNRSELDASIRLAEQRLMQRQDRIGRGLLHLKQRTQASARPERLVMIAAGGLAGLFSLRWLLRAVRPPQRRTRGMSQKMSSTSVKTRESLWLGLVPLLWPLLPELWRRRVPPTLATSIVGFVLPFAKRFIMPNKRRPHVPSPD